MRKKQYKLDCHNVVFQSAPLWASNAWPSAARMGSRGALSALNQMHGLELIIKNSFAPGWKIVQPVEKKSSFIECLIAHI